MSIVLRSRRGAIGTTWWAVALREALEGILGVGRAGGGKADARAGRVQWIDVDAGTVRGAVAALDRDAGSSGVHEARLDLPVLPPHDREAVRRAGAARPDLPALLAAGEYPEGVERELARSDVSLLPRGPAELSHDCTCLDWPGPCRHVAALAYVLVEAVEESPTLLLTVRGLALEDLLPDPAGAASPEPSPGTGASPGDGAAEDVDDLGERSGAPPAPTPFDPSRLDPEPLAAVVGPEVARLLLAFYRSGTPADLPPPPAAGAPPPPALSSHPETPEAPA